MTLEEWMKENNYTDTQVARKLAEMTGMELRASNVRAWRIGKCSPYFDAVRKAFIELGEGRIVWPEKKWGRPQLPAI